MRRNLVTDLIFLIVLAVAQAELHTPPGKPTITSCRSPEKETFSCWWEPGDTGGLPTTYRLFYRKENSDEVFECRDYHTAGINSCFFSKNETTIWVNYNISVVATNRLGRSYSDPLVVDVVYIVQPYTPENVTVSVEEDSRDPYLRILWEKPRNADTRSGWITLIYQLRIKLKNTDQWEEYDPGQQKVFNVFSPHSGGTYLVQVRCKPDHGLWSEWSPAAYAEVPDYLQRQRSVWIVIGIFAVLVFILLVWTLNLKRSRLIDCLLPPVPGPKIKGFDKTILKSGKSEDMYNALVLPGFPPPSSSSDYEDLLVEYLEVYDQEDQELMLDDGCKDLEQGGGCLKHKTSSDNDSGRGSCDSHTLLLEKCGGSGGGGGGRGLASKERDEDGEEGEPSSLESSQAEEAEAMTGTGTDIVIRIGNTTGTGETPSSTAESEEDGQPSGWPMLTTTSPAHHHHHHHHKSPPTSPQLDYTSPPMPIDSKHHHHKVLTTVNTLDGKTGGVVVGGTPPVRPMEYVEVQKVHQQNVLLLRPLEEQQSTSSYSSAYITTSNEEVPEEDYSKVKAVTSDNMLLLLQEEAPSPQSPPSPTCLIDYQHGKDLEEPQQQLQQAGVFHSPTANAHPAGMQLTSNGYVDTSMVPTY